MSMQSPNRETDANTLIDHIFDLFRTRGDLLYGEDVTERMHAMQCGTLALTRQCKPTLIAASLLHDIGHLIHDLGEDIAERGVDARHEDVGWAWLGTWFPPAVTEPVRMHVAAKRYLCAIHPSYLAGLSPASLRSLELQGGPMTPEEVNQFEAAPFWEEAVTLRHFDDLGKDAHLAEVDLEAFRPALLDSLAMHGACTATVHKESVKTPVSSGASTLPRPGMT